MLDPSSPTGTGPSEQGCAPTLTGRLLEALGRVDNDVQEPVEPGGLIICGGESRGCVRAQLPPPAPWGQHVGWPFPRQPLPP